MHISASTPDIGGSTEKKSKSTIGFGASAQFAGSAKPTAKSGGSTTAFSASAGDLGGVASVRSTNQPAAKASIGFGAGIKGPKRTRGQKTAMKKEWQITLIKSGKSCSICSSKFSSTKRPVRTC